VFATVMVGGNHSCAIDIGGAAFCWGFNDAGQLGIGSVTPGSGPAFANLFPNTVVDGHTFSATFGGASGSDHSCAITLQKTTYCWGFNVDGRLGNGQSGVDLKVPSPVAVSMPDFKAVSAGASHTCGLTSGDRLFCWGSNAEGKIGVGSGALSLPSPQAVAQNLAFSSVAAGGLHSCAVTTAGDLYCWGSNAEGQAGLGAVPGSTVPAQVTGTQYAQVAAGESHTCGLGQGGELYCWGANESGQLGDGTTSARDVPTLLAGFSFASITAGQHHTCGLTNAGIAFCWGLGTSGQLGNDAFGSSEVPVSVGGGLTFKVLSAGGNQTCGVTVGNVVYCWGYNFYGALGDGTQTNRSLPTKVAYQPE
jgi:alpha-tubulin suppressor-like RCC1 family protein